jgi:hypothetical protein
VFYSEIRGYWSHIPGGIDQVLIRQVVDQEWAGEGPHLASSPVRRVLLTSAGRQALSVGRA